MDKEDLRKLNDLSRRIDNYEDTARELTAAMAGSKILSITMPTGITVTPCVKIEKGSCFVEIHNIGDDKFASSLAGRINKAISDELADVRSECDKLKETFDKMKLS